MIIWIECRLINKLYFRHTVESESTVIITMKQTLIALLFTLCLRQIACQNCDVEGYSTISSPNKAGVICRQCNQGFAKCDNVTTFVDEISRDAYKEESNQLFLRCRRGDFNPDTQTCDQECKAGCLQCRFTTDFCLKCQSGYVWQSNYTCLPLIVPFQITTLVLQVIALIGAILAVIFAQKAKTSD